MSKTLFTLTKNCVFDIGYQSYKVLALCHYGLVPGWCRARLKIAAKQQLEHIGPSNLSFISLKQGKWKAGRTSAGNEGRGFSYLFWSACPSLYPHFSQLIPTKGIRSEKRGTEVRRKAGQKEMDKRSGWLWDRLSSEIPFPHPPFKSHLSLQSWHGSPQFYLCLEQE